jgi:DNA repair exonuclease SbcCD ATPase subunit|tara:strand:+ start:247 stop:495 length:249 start_codon:yes stop_codon:yes gene_type:complete
MEKTVLSQEELNNLATLQQQQDNFVVQLGQVEYQISTLERQKNIIKQNIESFEKQQVELGDQLKQKYGEGTINLESGEFVKA